MRLRSSLIACGAGCVAMAAIMACSSGDPGAAGSSPGGGEGGVADATRDADAKAPNEIDAGDPGTNVLPTPPSVQFIGRFDDGDALGPRAAWPGTRIVARFDGTGASVKLTQAAGSLGGPTYINVFVDGTLKGSVPVTGSGETVSLVSGLAAGTHTIEIEKRTDATLGVVRFEGFTFTGGKGLLSPTPRLTRRIEILGDSFISGFGVDGDVNDPAKCSGGTAPPEYNDARKSVAARAAQSLSAELHLTAMKGKGIARNQDGTSVDTFPVVFQRTLPEVAGAWVFSSFVPDVVVIALGAGDFDGAAFPADFQATYNQLITDLHARYQPTTKIILAVWSQHKSTNNMRQLLTATVDAVIAGRPNADKPYNSKIVFPEASPADETGCQGHATAAHHAAMAALLAAEIKATTGWQ